MSRWVPVLIGLAGGVAAPFIFGLLIQTGSRTALFYGYLAGAALMMGAGAVEAWIGVKAERAPLEEITAPLSEAITLSKNAA